LGGGDGDEVGFELASEFRRESEPRLCCGIDIELNHNRSEGHCCRSVECDGAKSPWLAPGVLDADQLKTESRFQCRVEA
jgi:hypothetical protein